MHFTVNQITKIVYVHSEKYRCVGLFWAGSIIHSVILIFLAAFVGMLIFFSFYTTCTIFCVVFELEAMCFLTCMYSWV